MLAIFLIHTLFVQTTRYKGINDEICSRRAKQYLFNGL